jgi:hypothetical protein
MNGEVISHRPRGVDGGRIWDIRDPQIVFASLFSRCVFADMQIFAVKEKSLN